MAKLHRAQASLQEVIRARQVGNWELTEPLGRGGQGTTWRAIFKQKDQSLTQVGFAGGRLARAVVKLMLPPDPANVPIPAPRFDAWLEMEAKGFLTEARVLSKLDCPYIPGVFEAAKQKTKAGWDVPWFATELISGRSLSEELGTNGPMDQNQILDLAHDILTALAAIHQVGLVHLDLKPDNVMLEPGKARLIDFGLVSVANQKGNLGGTPGYFTPEQLDNVLEERDFAPAADIFKLGVTLSIAAGIRLKDLWGTDPYGEDESVRRAMKKGPQLSGLKPTLIELITPMLAFEPLNRPAASASLHQVKSWLPAGNAKRSSQSVPTSGASQNEQQKSPQPVKKASPAVARQKLQPPVPAAAVKGDANVGTKVVVVDRLGLDWTGVVVGLDPRKSGNILVKHESTRGNDNVRSYALKQVVRGKPLK